MTLAPKTSTRFQRAAAAELRRLRAQQQKLDAEARRLEEALAKTKAALRTIVDRIQVLEEMTGEEVLAEPTGAEAERSNGELGQKVLRGAAIRETAIRTLVSTAAEQKPIHYRAWLKLLGDFGFRVEGKRPEAVFLNQVTRSPLVRATTKAGIYQLDTQVVDHLRSRLSELQRELATVLAQSSSSNGDLAINAARQDELTREIRRTGRALEEAQRSLSALDEEPAIAMAA